MHQHKVPRLLVYWIIIIGERGQQGQWRKKCKYIEIDRKFLPKKLMHAIAIAMRSVINYQYSNHAQIWQYEHGIQLNSNIVLYTKHNERMDRIDNWKRGGKSARNTKGVFEFGG